MSITLPSRSVHGIAFLGDVPVNFHSHHYNVVLEQSIEDAGTSVGAVELLKDGGSIAAYAQLAPALRGHSVAEGLAFGAEYFRGRGFGRIDLSGLTETGGRVRLTHSHYSLGFRGRSAYGERRTPADHFACGYVEAASAAAFGAPVGTFEVAEVESALVTGRQHSILEVKRVERPRPLPTAPRLVLPDTLPPRPPSRSNIDEAAILSALATIPLEGNDEGLIPKFGVYLSLHYADYYNYISFEFLRRLTEKNPTLAAAGEACLIEAGHACGFNTFGGIMTSPEWNAVVGPMIRERRDWVHGITSCINGLGWGRWTVADLTEDKLVMQIDASYEGTYYRGAYGKSAVPRCYFARGAIGSIMDLFYTGDITKKPKLDFAYYDDLFSGPVAFDGVETRCVAMGDPYCEITATRKRFG